MKARKLLALILSASMVMSMVACGSTETKEAKETAAETSADAADEVLTMATTTSTADTGLLDYLAPIFKEDTGYTLEYTAVGTGEAISMGQNGDVDIILVHSKASEEEFVNNGYGVERFPVMYNDFVVVGPEEEDAYGDDLEACLKAVAEGEWTFVSRGDDSGTHKKELK